MKNEKYQIYDPLECFDETYYFTKNEVIEFANEEVAFTDYPNTKFVSIKMALIFLDKYGFEILNYNIKDNYEVLDNWLEKYNRSLKHRICKYFKYQN